MYFNYDIINLQLVVNNVHLVVRTLQQVVRNFLYFLIEHSAEHSQCTVGKCLHTFIFYNANKRLVLWNYDKCTQGICTVHCTMYNVYNVNIVQCLTVTAL